MRMSTIDSSEGTTLPDFIDVLRSLTRDADHRLEEEHGSWVIRKSGGRNVLVRLLSEAGNRSLMRERLQCSDGSSQSFTIELAVHMPTSKYVYVR
jgi:hypothetical protein